MCEICYRTACYTVALCNHLNDTDWPKHTIGDPCKLKKTYRNSPQTLVPGMTKYGVDRIDRAASTAQLARRPLALINHCTRDAQATRLS